MLIFFSNLQVRSQLLTDSYNEYPGYSAFIFAEAPGTELVHLGDADSVETGGSSLGLLMVVVIGEAELADLLLLTFPGDRCRLLLDLLRLKGSVRPQVQSFSEGGVGIASLLLWCRRMRVLRALSGYGLQLCLLLDLGVLQLAEVFL